MSGFFDAEGCPVASVNEGSLDVSLTASNTNVTILELIKKLLQSKFRITSSIRVGKKPRGTSIVHGQKVRFGKTVFALRISRRRDVVAFATRIGFASAVKQQKL